MLALSSLISFATVGSVGPAVSSGGGSLRPRRPSCRLATAPDTRSTCASSLASLA
ncbi:hypothetical protein PF005_g27833 [Phytophthora fragariae]|nr:hypothetical protein PF011_g17384 [Phytophthora fragariae]KAE9033496.1 hypothetical protein PR002_g8643 [Phytophthora rubi]KAE9039769.1 hypothetical protein PR001_g7368 [Phytophthora rubi]KAE9068207.1 hypothetical protein PF007_g27778 [Phytophthora fragariae]KAE9079647.1 hypothetical protein PF006_g27476 [Phytophthora fragariae]